MSETAWRNRHDETWGGPNPATCDDRVWWEISGMCGGCGSEDCHDGPCGEVESWFDRLTCDRCPDRRAQGIPTPAHPTHAATADTDERGRA